MSGQTGELVSVALTLSEKACCGMLLADGVQCRTMTNWCTVLSYTSSANHYNLTIQQQLNSDQSVKDLFISNSQTVSLAKVIETLIFSEL